MLGFFSYNLYLRDKSRSSLAQQGEFLSLFIRGVARGGWGWPATPGHGSDVFSMEKARGKSLEKMCT